MMGTFSERNRYIDAEVEEMMNVAQKRDIAVLERLSSLGARFVRLEPKSKKPSAGQGWNDPMKESAIHEDAFLGLDLGYNIGILTGAGGFIDVDIDVRKMGEDGAIRRSSLWVLGYLNRVLGRSLAWGRRSSLSEPPLPTHVLYRLRDESLGRTLKLEYLEIRYKSSDGKYMQSMVPPSIHPSGDVLVWVDAECEVAEVDYGALERAVRIADAVLSLAVKYKAGSRHDFVGALSGWLARRGWSVGDVQELVRGLVEYTGDDELSDRMRRVEDAFAALERDGNVWGYPTLVSFIGEELGRVVAKSLGVKPEEPMYAGVRNGSVVSGSQGEVKPSIPMEKAVAKRLFSLVDRVYITSRGSRYIQFRVGGRDTVVEPTSETFYEWALEPIGDMLGKAPSDEFLKRVGVYMKIIREEEIPAEKLSFVEDACLRVGGSVSGDVERDVVYVATHNESGDIIRITADGWRYISPSESPVLFLRDTNMESIPGDLPHHTEDNVQNILLLSRYVRGGVKNFILSLVGILSSYYTERGLPKDGKKRKKWDTSRPILAIVGMQMSGKSTLATNLLRLMDDVSNPKQTGVERTTDIRSLLAKFNSQRVVIMDNISRIDRELSNILCTIADDAPYTIRRLYTSGTSESTRDYYGGYENSLIITTIEDAIRASDLASRTIPIQLPPMEGGVDSGLLEEAFNVEYPLIQSALFSLVSCCIRNYPLVKSLDDGGLLASVRYGKYVRFAAAGLMELGIDPFYVFSLVSEANKESLMSSSSGDFLTRVAEVLLERCEQEGGVFEVRSSDLLQLLKTKITDDDLGVSYQLKDSRVFGRWIQQERANLLALHGLEVEKLPRRRDGYFYRIRVREEEGGLFSVPASDEARALKEAERYVEAIIQAKLAARPLERVVPYKLVKRVSRESLSELWKQKQSKVLGALSVGGYGSSSTEDFVVSEWEEGDPTDPDDNPPGGGGGGTPTPSEPVPDEPAEEEFVVSEWEVAPEDGDGGDGVVEPTPAEPAPAESEGGENPLLQEWARLPIPPDRREGMRRIAELAYALGYPPVEYGSIVFTGGERSWLFSYRSIPIFIGAVEGILNILETMRAATMD